MDDFSYRNQFFQKIFNKKNGGWGFSNLSFKLSIFFNGLFLDLRGSSDKNWSPFDEQKKL
jgi:hypothetical protein